MRPQRLKRSRTGCQDCRKRRVRCLEGKFLPEGGREECLMCKRGGVKCFYPLNRSGERKQMWVQAKDYPIASSSRDQLESSVHAGETNQSSGLSCSSTGMVIEEVSSWINSIPSNLDLGPTTFTAELTFSNCEIDSILNSCESIFSLTGDSQYEGQSNELESTHENMLAVGSTIQVPLWQRRAIRNLFSSSQSILPPFSEPGITQMTNDHLDVFAVRNFENTGCKEIVSVGHQNRNWIYSLLLPRIMHVFSETVNQKSSSEHDAAIAIKRYCFHALMQLSYVHQANTQTDHNVAIEANVRAMKHRSLAYTAAFHLRVRHPASSWQVEEYMMAFFITCMADMLSSQPFQVDAEANLLYGRSTFSKSLKGLLGIYRSLSEICMPSDPIRTPKIDPDAVSFDFFEDSDSDPWVENFFGFSISSIECFRNVNKLVSYRVQLLRSTEEDTPGKERLKAFTTDLVENLEVANDWKICPWTKGLECKPRRVQRGTMVVSQVIAMIVYAELLQLDLLESDKLEKIRQSTVELVADTCIEELAGYHLMLAILAIYTPELKQRDTYLDILTMAQTYSFGHAHKGLREIVRQCWEIYDGAGKYMNGIAPWREIMYASGVSMCV